MSSTLEMMKRAVTQQRVFYSSPFGVKDAKERKADAQRAKRQRLQQWYGMKCVSRTPHFEREMELLKYRGFLSSETSFQTPQRVGKNDVPEFAEEGYFVGIGRKKRRRIRSFADEWLEENSELEDVVRRRMKLAVRRSSQQRQKLRRENEKQEAKEARNGKAGRQRRIDAW